MTDFTRTAGNGLKIHGLLNENAFRAVDHDLADVWVQDEVLDWAKEGENQLESIHHTHPSANYRK